jgi:hypothetical protein
MVARHETYNEADRLTYNGGARYAIAVPDSAVSCRLTERDAWYGMA